MIDHHNRKSERSGFRPLLAALHRSRRGSITMVAVVFMMIMIATFAGSIVLGRVLMGHHELQTAADSVAMSAALVLQTEGMGLANNRATHDPSLRGNTKLQVTPPYDLHFNLHPDGSHTDIHVILRSNILPDFGILDNVGPLPIEGRSTARVREHHLDDVTQIIPRMVLVLDYSGSMAQRDGGAGLTRLQALREAVFALLDMQLDVDFGMVMYSSDVIDTVAISSNSERAIRTAMMRRGPGGATNTSAALDMAGQLYAGSDTEGRHTLLITDGYPCCHGSSAPAAINSGINLRNGRDVSNYVLDIYAHTGFHSSRRIAGPKDSDHPDPAYYFQANNRVDLMARLRNVITSLVCRAGPLDPPPGLEPVARAIPPRASTSHRIFAFLRSPNGREYPAEAVYEPSTRMLRLTDADACEQVLDQNHSIVVRYDTPRLGR